MHLVLIAALVVASFAALARRAEAGNKLAATVATLESLALVIVASVALYAATVLLELQCDDGCDDYAAPDVRTGRWFDTQDAWQWWGQLGLAGAALLAAVAFAYLTTKRRYGEAILVLISGLVCIGGWAAMLAPLGQRFGI